MQNNPDESEEAFLARYDASRFAAPLVTVDAALYCYDNAALKVLLVRRTEHPRRHADPHADRRAGFEKADQQFR